MAATTIDGVLAALDGIIRRARAEADRIGYFAVLYRTVTAKVRDGIAEGFFDDGERMEQLDCVFAHRYLDAVAAHRARGRPTRSWDLAFDAAAQWRPTVVQHLLLGMNAHINLDLGVAAAQTAPGDDLPGLRRDFDRINEILAALVGDVRRSLAAVSPWVGLADRLGGRGDDELVNFSIAVARTEAWRFAVELAPLPPDQLAGPIGVRDLRVARIGRAVWHPGWLSTPLLAVRLREGLDVPAVMDRLADVPPPTFAEVDARVRAGRAHP